MSPKKRAPHPHGESTPEDAATSRRSLLHSLLVASAASAGAALLGGCEGNDTGLVRSLDGGGTPETGSAAAPETGADDTSAPVVDARDAGSGGDVTALNALLGIEYGAIAAYAAGAAILAAPAASDPLVPLAPVLLAVANHFHDHHVAHAEALSSAIQAIGGMPIATSSVVFAAPPGFTASVTNVLKLACNAERAAALSYVSAVPAFSAATHRFLAAITLGDETQHFMVLYALLKGTVGPGANLSASTATQVVPEPFVATEPGSMSLEDIVDFDVTM